MYNILIVDFTPYRETIARMFTEAGYTAVSCESAFDAMARLKSNDFDLIVSEVELPGDNAFDLYNYIANYYPFIPTIMVTEKDIDTFFEHIFREGIGNVLRKPLREKELVGLARKLITRKNIFGLDNYMDIPVDGIMKVRVTASDQIRQAIAALMNSWRNGAFRLKTGRSSTSYSTSSSSTLSIIRTATRARRRTASRSGSKRASSSTCSSPTTRTATAFPSLTTRATSPSRRFWTASGGRWKSRR